MTESLAEALRAELECDGPTAATIAGLAREWLPRITNSGEDSDEDLVQRLRDPRVFGEFAASVIEDVKVDSSVCQVLADHAFDLLPLPRGEGDVIAVEVRAPRRLLTIARWLADAHRLTVLHVMHLVFATFLDREIVRVASRGSRSGVLMAVVELPEAAQSLRVFYGAMHLGGVPEPEAHREFRRILESNAEKAIKDTLAKAAMADDGGVETLLRTAREEGLVSADSIDPTALEAIVNIPRLPPRLRALGRRWLQHER